MARLSTALPPSLLIDYTATLVALATAEAAHARCFPNARDYATPAECEAARRAYFGRQQRMTALYNEIKTLREAR